MALASKRYSPSISSLSCVSLLPIRCLGWCPTNSSRQVFIESTLCAEVASLFSTLFEACRARGLLDGFPVLQALQDLVDAYCDSRSALTIQWEMDNIKSWPHSGSSVSLARKFFQDLFARERLTEQETRHELDSASWYRATRANDYSKVVRVSAPTWLLDIHSKAPLGSLNNFETNWEVYDRQKPENNKRHIGMKTGLQGHVHALPDLRTGFNRWAGEHNIYGMVDKEVVRAFLERQDIDGLHLLLSRSLTLQQNQPEGMTSANHEWAVHRQRLGNLVPMNTLNALVMRCCFRCDHPMHGEDSHSIKDFNHAPSVKEQVGMDHSTWGTRWGSAGPSGTNAFLVKQLARQHGTAPGATYVTSASSQPYTCQVFLTQFMYSLVSGLGCTPFQCQTRRGCR